MRTINKKLPIGTVVFFYLHEFRCSFLEWPHFFWRDSSVIPKICRTFTFLSDHLVEGQKLAHRAKFGEVPERGHFENCLFLKNVVNRKQNAAIPE